MIDVRYKIKELAEQTLESFVRFRLIDLCIEDEWKTGLTDFVSEESKDHLANYKDLYDFLQNNNEQDVTLEQMDITTLSALVLHYPKWEGICKVSTGSKKLFINHVKQMRELRNSIVHNKEKLTELNLEILYYDQLYF